MNFTPGPWRLRDGMLKENSTEPLDRAGEAVCKRCKKQAGHTLPAQIQILAKGWGVAQLGTLDPRREHEQHLANARLIVAAPELAAALSAFVAFTSYVTGKRESNLTSEHLVLDDEDVDNANTMLTDARALLARIDGQ